MSGAAVLAGTGIETEVWGNVMAAAAAAAGTGGIGREEGVEITLMMAGTT